MSAEKSIPTTGVLPEQKFYHSFTDKYGKEATGACAFTYNRDLKELRYGASIYRPDEGSRTKKPTRDEKHGISQTATQRLRKCPVIIKNFENPSSVEEFRDYLRGQLETFKLKGARL